MTLPVSPDILLAMLRQERLQQVDVRATADEKIRVIEAQIGVVEMTLQIQKRAAEAAETTEQKAD